MRRRDFLTQLLALTACGVLPVLRVHTATAQNGSPADGQPFSPEGLREIAQRLAREPYVPPTDARPSWLAAMDYDDYQALNKFRIDHNLWAGGELPFQAQFFHLGLYFHHPVSLYEVANDIARPITFSPEMFNYGPRVKDQIPAQAGDLGLPVSGSTTASTGIGTCFPSAVPATSVR